MILLMMAGFEMISPYVNINLYSRRQGVRKTTKIVDYAQTIDADHASTKVPAFPDAANPASGTDNGNGHLQSP